MNASEYIELFDTILNRTEQVAPYDDPAFLDYAKLNASRFKRWMKTMEIDETFSNFLQTIKTKQHWIIITEPWCGDAAHIVPFLLKFAELSPAITCELQLRDSEPFLIDSYLTNGGKAIPKLVSRNEQGEDLFVWGPRPAKAQELYVRLKEENADFEKVKIELQNWYNDNKGEEIIKELTELLKNY